MRETASSARRAEAAVVDGYLARLGIEDPGEPSAAALADLHARHLERVTYTNLDLQLGRPTPVDPADSAQRIARTGRGGYCLHLNSAFSLLLEALGYRVSWRRGTVQDGPDAPPSTRLNHLVLLVHDLPTDDHPDGTWWADVGLGDGFSRPLSLRAGRRDDPPYAYELTPSPVYAGGWRLLQHPPGAFVVADADVVAPAREELDAAHCHLSTWPQSGFVRTATAQRRDAAGVDILRACTLTRTETCGTRRTLLDREADWFAALTDLFGMDLADVSAAERRALWLRVRRQHEEWAAEDGA